MRARTASALFLAGIPLLSGACGARPGTGREARTPGAFQAKIDDGGSFVIRPGATTVRSVTVRNLSTAPFFADGRIESPGVVNASYHWLDATGNVVVFDGARTALPSPLAPGEATGLDMKVVAPAQRGSYLLEVDLVLEGVTWFGARGSETSRTPVRVE